MLVAAELAKNGQTISDVIGGLPNAEDYAGCGGRFSLHTADGQIFGFAGVSGMADTNDHATLINDLNIYLIAAVGRYEKRSIVHTMLLFLRFARVWMITQTSKSIPICVLHKLPNDCVLICRFQALA